MKTKAVRLMNSVSMQSGLMVLGILLIGIVLATVITFAAYHSDGYIALTMLIGVVVLVAGAVMIAQHPEWLTAPKTKNQGTQAWTFVVFIVLGALGIEAALFAMIEGLKKR